MNYDRYDIQALDESLELVELSFASTLVKIIPVYHLSLSSNTSLILS